MTHTVKITLASLGDPPPTLVLIELNDANLLEGLDDLAVNGAGGVDVPRGARAPVLGRAVDLPQAADTDSHAEVDVARDGRGAHVEPVDVLGGKLLGGAGLDQLNPSCGSLARPEPTWGQEPKRGIEKRRENTNQGWGACPGASGKPRRH